MKPPKVISVYPLEKYRIRIKFNDETEGVLDLSDSAGKGVFRSWDSDNSFDKAFISKETGAITWPGDIDIDTLNCYLQIKGISYEQYKSLQEKQTHAFR
jgi:hypothetical protein